MAALFFCVHFTERTFFYGDKLLLENLFRAKSSGMQQKFFFPEEILL